LPKINSANAAARRRSNYRNDMDVIGQWLVKDVPRNMWRGEAAAGRAVEREQRRPAIAIIIQINSGLARRACRPRCGRLSVPALWLPGLLS